MFSQSFRAAAAAFVLGTAALAAGTVGFTVTAEAAARPAVARLLNDAIRQAAAGNVSAARASVGQAENVGGLTPGDHAEIDKVKSYISRLASGGGGGLAGDYRAGHYSSVIAAGRRGGLGADDMVLVAQSYYLTHDFAGCTSYIRNNLSGGGENILQMLQRCAYENQDNDGQRYALEQLVSRTNKPEYWSSLLDAASGTKGLSDHGTLDVYRLKLLTGSLVKAEDYNLLAQLALQLGFASESVAVINKATAAKLQLGPRTGALVAMANGQAAANAAKLAAVMANGNGDVLVHAGEDLWGQGKFPDALKLIQAGIKKGVGDKSNAQIRLGMALMSTGDKSGAVRAFSSVDDPKQKVIAHVWEIYARTH